MQFALQGIRFDAFITPDELYYGGVIATNEDGLSATFFIADYVYGDNLAVNAVRAAQGFLNKGR